MPIQKIVVSTWTDYITLQPNIDGSLESREGRLQGPLEQVTYKTNIVVNRLSWIDVRVWKDQPVGQEFPEFGVDLSFTHQLSVFKALGEHNETEVSVFFYDGNNNPIEIPYYYYDGSFRTNYRSKIARNVCKREHKGTSNIYDFERFSLIKKAKVHFGAFNYVTISKWVDPGHICVMPQAPFEGGEDEP